MKKVALVTGSTSGIGLGIAEALLDKGYTIILNGFGDKTEIESTLKKFQEQNSNCLYDGADLSKASEIEAMISRIITELGRLDVIINNAGIQHTAPIEDFPPEKWDAIMAINLTSAFHIMRLALPYMRKSGWGRIINIASAHGLVGSPHKAAYVAAKHGILGLNKVVALETANDNITCNAICPGWVETPLMRKQVEARALDAGKSYEEELANFIGEKQPMHKTPKPQDIGALCAFLCSDEAAAITGASYSVDGGWTVQ